MGDSLPTPAVIMHFGKERGNVGNLELADTSLGFALLSWLVFILLYSFHLLVS